MADATQILRNLRNLSCDKVGALSHPLYRDGHFAYVAPRAEYMDQLMKRGRAMAGSLIHQGSISVRRARLIKPMMKHFIVKITHNIRIRCTPAATDPAPWLRSRISCLRGTKFLQHSCARARLQVYLPDKTLQTYLQRLVYGFHLPEVIRSSHFRSLGTFQERIDPEEIYNAASG